MKRNRLCKIIMSVFLTICVVVVLSCDRSAKKDDEVGWRSLFDGETLNGWYAAPRLPPPQFPGARGPNPDAPNYQIAMTTSGHWEVVDGAIIGKQEILGFGGWLVSEETFGDFELRYEANPDWPADSGVMLRASALGSQGFQVLLDHRRSGGIGGFFGNGLGAFHGVSFNVDAEYDDAGNATRMIIETDNENSLRPITPEKQAILSYAIDPEEFLKIWKFLDWNEFRVRCVGEYPVITTWINGVKAYEIDTGAIEWPNYNKEDVLELLGRRGHIAFEIHNNDALGEARWAPGNAIRWRNIYIKEL